MLLMFCESYWVSKLLLEFSDNNSRWLGQWLSRGVYRCASYASSIMDNVEDAMLTTCYTPVEVLSCDLSQIEFC